MGEDRTQPTSVRKRGRHALPAEEVKRHAVGIRTTKKLKDLLQRAADSSGRSVAQEIEFRLERSFVLEETFGGALLSPIGLGMSAAFALAGQRAQQLDPESMADWIKDPWCFEQAALAVADFLWLQHPDPVSHWGSFRDWLSRLYGRVGFRLKKNSAEAPAIGPSMIELVGAKLEDVEP